MELFRRAWRVQVGSLVTEDLHIKFKIARSMASGRAGTCELEIYNLSEAHRREITSAPRRTTFVEVLAGYRGGMSMLFRGDLRKAVTAKENTDWITKVTAGDGEHAIRTARVSRSFARGTTVAAVAQHLADAMGVGAGNAREALRAASLDRDETSYPEGTVLYGSAAVELTRLCDSARLTWSIQGGVLQVLPLGGNLSTTAILLSPSTGLIDAVEVVNHRTVQVKALIQPGLVPGQRVVLQSAVVRESRFARAVDIEGGTWRIDDTEYTGDVAGNDWTASMTLHRPLPPLVTA